MEFPFGVFLLMCICRTPVFSQDAPVITPSFAVLFPGSEVIFSCINATSVIVWSIDRTAVLTLPPGVSVVNATALRVNMSANATMYGCVDLITVNNLTFSNNATLVLAAAPANVTNIMIDLNTVNIDNNNVSFILNWDEPFDNFDPIVNYTITINCNDASCPVMFTVTTTSASVSFITDFSVTPLSVTATNTIGTSDPTTIRIAVPDGVGMVNLTCGAVESINRCTVTWNAPSVNDPSVVAAPISYTVYYFGDNIANGSVTVDVPMATIDLPAVDSDVNVTAMNVFGSGPASNIAQNEIMAPSVINATVTLVTPNENTTLHSIIVTCIINLDSTADMCEVIATANDQTIRTGVSTIHNGMATVTVHRLTCGVTYTIIAGGTFNGDLVGPRSYHGTVTAGPCLPIIRCPAEGQVHTECGSACAPTCKERNPRPCTLQCVARCQCPNDTILDEENNKCVTVDQCPPSCSPVCSHEYCSAVGNRNKPCSRPPPYSTPACPDQCYSTYCRACYYSKRPRKTPQQCNDSICTNPMKPVCHRNWAKCVYRQNRKKNKCSGNCITAENFRCYDYPTCTNLRG